MKKYKDYIKESMDIEPEPKFPINYKCTHIYDIVDTLKDKYGLEVGNLQPGVATRNVIHDFSFYRFIDKKIQSENTIFPKVRLNSIDKSEDLRMNDYTDPGSVVLLPMHYDSSKDEIEHKKYKENGMKNLLDGFKQLFFMRKKELPSQKEVDEYRKQIEDNVNFGVSNYEWVNIALDKIYEEYKTFFVSGYLRVWMPFDWDSNTEFEGSDKNTAHGYPMDKMFFLSDIESYLKTNYGLEDEQFYEFIYKNDYVENRYWEKPLGISVDENYKFLRNSFGMKATKNIDAMLSIMEMEFEDEIKKIKYESFPIYIDYYKKIDTRF